VKLPGGVGRSSASPAAPGSQSGAALIVALLVFALCTALVVAMESEFNRFYQRGANILLAEQAYAYLRGAEELATLALLADYDAEDRDNPRDDLLEIWAQPPPPYALDEGGWMAGCLRDLQGRFNLNALAARVGRQDDESGTQADKPRFTPAQAQFIRLLQALGEPQLSEQEARLITEAVTDWLDADLEPAFDGAEDDYYFGQTPGYRAANRAMASVSELRAVAGVTPELYRALEPWVTVWPQQPATLNIHTAGSMVLRSINVDDDLSPLSVADGEALQAQQRPPGPGFVDMDDFFDSAVLAGKQEQMERIKPLLGESSSYFLLSAEVEVADRRMRLYSVLQRSGRQVAALARGSGIMDNSLENRGDEDSCKIAPSLDW
jgi:general secretion pathway protein K